MSLLAPRHAEAADQRRWGGLSLPLLGAIGAAALALVLGLLAGLSAKYAILAVVGVGFVFVVFADLSLGVAFFAAFTFLDQLGGGAGVSPDKLAGVLLVLSWALRRSVRAQTDARTVIGRHPRIFAWIMVLLAYSVMSAAWAVVPSASLSYVFRDILQLLLIPIVYAAVDTRRDVFKIVAGFLIGAIISAVYGFLHPVSATAAAAGRSVGTIGDPNQQAAVLVAAIALALGLAVVGRRSAWLATLAAVSVLLCAVATVATLSRSGLLAFLGMLVAGAVLGGQWRRWARALLVIGVAGLALYFGVFATGFASRVTSSNSDGRSTIWTVGLRMFAANPVLGVGAGNFQQASSQYLERPGLTTAPQFIIVTPKVAHNIYLEQAATLGVPGFIIMIAIFVGGIVAALRAAHIFERIGDPELDLMARACVLGMIGFDVSNFFISGLQTKQFWLIFGLGLALAKLAETERAGLAV